MKRQKPGRTTGTPNARPAAAPHAVGPASTPAVTRAREALEDARDVIAGTTMNTVLAHLFSPYATLDLAACGAAMRASCAQVRRGDLGNNKAMLHAQFIVLNAIFTKLAACAAGQLNQPTLAPRQFDVAERLLRMAFRAQGQGRATAETLALMTNPPSGAVFAKQANIAHGPQQVNNGGPTRPDTARARAANHEPGQVKQSRELEAHVERMDARTQGRAVARDSSLEAVGTVHGPADARRQGAGREKRVSRRAAAPLARPHAGDE